MKLIDRYVIFSFLRDYLISFMVLVGMYVVMDMVFNFNHMVDVQSAPGAAAPSIFSTIFDIVDFYFYQCFLIFVSLSGIIPVVAAAFTLMRLSRFNELTALLAAGVPLLRIAAPIVFASVLLNVFLLVDQELVIPQMIPKLMRDHDDVHRSTSSYYAIDSMQDAEGGLLRASRFFPPTSDQPAWMKDIDVIQRKSKGMDGQDSTLMVPTGHLVADEAHWNPAANQWDLTNGRQVNGLNAEVITVGPAAIYKSNVTPEEIALYHSGNFVDLLPTRRIDELMTRPNLYGKMDLLRVKHYRRTQPLFNVVLLLLTIPCVLTREPSTLKTAASRALGILGLSMAVVFVCHQLASQIPGFIAVSPSGPDTWVMLMAWMPIFIFGPVSVFLLDRVKT
jgi:lipopolysaccharide export LptBFGC system permease protein LptF